MFNQVLSNDATGQVLAAVEQIAGVKGVFITDESTFADFFLYDEELKKISDILKMSISRHDKVTSVIQRLDRRINNWKSSNRQN